MRTLLNLLQSLVIVVLLISHFGPCGFVPTATAQVRTTYDEGAAGLGQLLRRLQTTASAMHIGAHPDDEDSALIARLTRGDGARVAYLSLTRGEGGQNIIGRELFEPLGVIRTEELLQARRLDGGDQFFTRAMDYGFSKTRAEAAAKWGEREVLADMVRAIRLYRPLVIFSRFSGTPSDGHGQHQLAGYLAPLAFHAAADPAQFPEQIAEGLRPWQARKFYVGRFGASDSGGKSLRVETGDYDQLLGRTYFQIAMEGRSQHKSQEMGRIELLGPQASVLHRGEVADGKPSARETTMFDGLDVSISGIASLVGLRDQTIANDLAQIEDKAKRALATYDAFAPQKIAPLLAEGLTLTQQTRAALAAARDGDKSRPSDADFMLERKEKEFSEALKLASGLVFDVLAETETAAPGESFSISVRAFYTDKTNIRVGDLKLKVPAGWRAERMEAKGVVAQTNFYSREAPTTEVDFRVTIPVDAPLTQPYWLREKRVGDLFRWPADAPKTRAVDGPLIVGELTFELSGARVTFTQPLEYRFGDRVRGELRRDFNIVPALSVALDPARIVLPRASLKAKQRVAVRLLNNAMQPVTGTLALRLPVGWTAEPTSAPFALKAKGERTAIFFDVQPPPGTNTGNYQIKAVATTTNAPAATAREYTQMERILAYPHIQTHRLYGEAATNIQVMDLKVAPVRVGYVMGSGDDVPEAIRLMGLSVTMLDENALAAGDLAAYDVIVVGIRASEVRPDLISNNERLLDYVRRGGTLIVQYQQYDYVERKLAPLPATMAARVTDETATVTILQPQQPVFNYPNTITDADWNNWVQERSLYNFATFDPAYVPLLESHDAGDAAQRGGELYLRLGRGNYIYTSYAWFRQLPAGVPGAYRLFANLLSLARARTTKSDKLSVKTVP